MNTPLVSIIIPTYNRAHLIGETLYSVLAQTYTNWECIIVDDGSTDDTVEVVGEYLKKDSRFKYFTRPIELTKGANSCRNYGYGLSTGEYVNWFDSDDIMHPDFIKIKIKYLNEKKYKIIICSGYFVDNRLKILRELNYYDAKNLFKTYSMYKSEILTPSVLIKKDFLIKYGLFKLNLSRGQETEFFYRIFFDLNNVEYKYTDDKLFYYRQHCQSITSKNEESYNFENRFSQAYTTIENIKRGFLLKDKDIINHTHRFSLYILFSALKFKDYKTSCYILNNYEEIYSKGNANVLFYIKLYVKILFRFKVLNNKIEKIIKKMKLKT